MSMLVIKNKKKFIRGILIIVVSLAIIIWLLSLAVSGIISLFKNILDKPKETTTNVEETTQVSASVDNVPNANEEILSQWNLKLVNKDNSVNRDYIPELEELDDGVKFDKRAISYLRNMINAMNKAGITKVWVQSAYRSYEKQEKLFNNKVDYYKQKGNNQDEAENLAAKIVQRPEMSEHNLGLAADFNTVTNEFEKTTAFEWLEKNAADYGFILRYPEDKQEITGITYESWHWRYVGAEHAKVIKEKGYCLEEYIEYLKDSKQGV